MATVPGWNYEFADEEYETMSSVSNYYEAIPPPLPSRMHETKSCTVSGNPSYELNRPPIPPPLPKNISPPTVAAIKASKSEMKNSPKKSVTDSIISNQLILSESSLSNKSLSGSREVISIDKIDPETSLVLSIKSVSEDSQKGSQSLNTVTPSGYNLMDVFSNGNVIFIVPSGYEKYLPLTTNGKMIRGGGTFTDDSRFEVTIPRGHSTECVIALRNIKYSERYLCIDSKGKIKLRDGYKDSCDFFVNQVSSCCVSFESARSDGFYLGIKAKSAVPDAGSITSDSMEAQFTIIADKMLNSKLSSKLTAFGENSLMSNIRDREVVRLYSHRRYLGIDKKGRVVQNHNAENSDCWFVLFDRGMGVVSLRSYQYSGYWLRITDSQLQAKGMFGPDALLRVKESADHLVCFESMLQPGVFLLPPLRNTVTTPSPLFTLEIVLLPQMPV